MRRGGGFRGDRRALRRPAGAAPGGDPCGDRKTRRFDRSVQAALAPGSVSGRSAEVRFEQGEAPAGIALAGSTRSRLSRNPSSGQWTVASGQEAIGNGTKGTGHWPLPTAVRDRMNRAALLAVVLNFTIIGGLPLFFFRRDGK